MLALWLTAGLLAGQAAEPPVVADVARYGGDDAPRSVRPIIYLWPEQKAKAVEAIGAVEAAIEAEPEAVDKPAINEAIARLQTVLEADQTAPQIRAALAGAMDMLTALEQQLAHAERAAIIEAMRQEALAAARAREIEQADTEAAIALLLLA